VPATTRSAYKNILCHLDRSEDHWLGAGEVPEIAVLAAVWFYFGTVLVLSNSCGSLRLFLGVKG